MKKKRGQKEGPNGELIGQPRPRLPTGAPFRKPHRKTARKTGKALDELMSHAKEHGLRVYFYTFSSRSFGSDAEVMADLKRRWKVFQRSRRWRRIPGAIWTFGDHERPHIHLVAALPPGMTVKELRDQWDGGHSNTEKVRQDDYSRLGLYLAAQRGTSRRLPHARLRKVGIRRPRRGGLACSNTPASITPCGAQRTAATSRSFGNACAPPPLPRTKQERSEEAPTRPEEAGDGGRDGASGAGERPQAVPETHSPTQGGGVSTSEHACESEQPTPRDLGALYPEIAFLPPISPAEPSVDPDGYPTIPRGPFAPQDLNVALLAMVPVLVQKVASPQPVQVLAEQADLAVGLAKQVLDLLLDAGTVELSGAGTRSDPHRYQLIENLPVPSSVSPIPEHLRFSKGSKQVITLFPSHPRRAGGG